MSESINISGGFFIPLLTCLFVGLKLTGHIAWSWLWVLSPLWIGFAIGGVLLVIAFIIWLIAEGR